jgi:hypothetical protein
MTFSHPIGVRTLESWLTARPYSANDAFANHFKSALPPKFEVLTAAACRQNYIALSLVSWMLVLRVYDSMADGTLRPGPAKVVAPH